MELMFEEKISRIIIATHSELNLSDYDSTNCQAVCNCYSHAIGSTIPFKEIYRIGAISGLKGVTTDYYSVDELVFLLYEDLKVLELGIEEYQGEELLENQYLIRLYVKAYRNNKIFDYHFTRCDNGIWTEKWRNEKARLVVSSYNFFPWNKVGTYKITK